MILRNARIAGAETDLRDIEIRDGVIVNIAMARTAADTPEGLDLRGRLVSAGLVETHIHLDKAMLMDRVASGEGGLDDAIEEVARLKSAFTPGDVHDRAARVLERSLRNGATHVRTHLEVDPGVGMRSFEGVWPLIQEYAWALDLEICVFPQEGLLGNPGTDELMVDALRRGAHAVGGAPYTDTDPRGQIERIFQLAREFDVDIDMHLDFGPGPDDMDLFYLCDQTDRYSYGGRVTIGHVTKLAAAPPALFEKAGRRLADAGVAVTVLPSTDLYLMGRERAENKVRGVVEAHRLLRYGVNCSLSTNNVLNPFTPLGDVSLMRMANLYANIAQVGSDEDFRECFNMITSRPAALLNLRHYGVEAGNAADLVVFDAASRHEAVRSLSPLLFAFKRGARTVTNPGVQVHRPPVTAALAAPSALPVSPAPYTSSALSTSSTSPAPYISPALSTSPAPGAGGHAINVEDPATDRDFRTAPRSVAAAARAGNPDAGRGHRPLTGLPYPSPGQPGQDKHPIAGINGIPSMTL